MTTLVQQLQVEALDQKIPVSQLLRKAKVVATKLDLEDFSQWIDNEMGGYKQGKDIPPYREIYVELKGFNPYRGWQPVIFEDPKTQNEMYSRKISQEISGLENVIKDQNSTHLQVPLNAEAKHILSKGLTIPVDLTHFASRSAVVGILNAVRNIVLEWSLKLEKAGILGEDFSFSAEDRTKAHENKIIYQINEIKNFTGAMGPVSDQAVIKVSQVNSLDTTELSQTINQLKKYIADLPLEPTKKDVLETQVSTVDDELKSQKPNQDKIKLGLSSIKNILEDVAGNMIAQGAVALIAKHLA